MSSRPNSIARRRLGSGSLRAASSSGRPPLPSGRTPNPTEPSSGPQKTYWRVMVEEVPGYNLPRGYAVATLEKDNVFESLFGCEDAFGTSWLAVLASPDDDVVWVPIHDPNGELTMPRVPLVAQMTDESGTKFAAGTGSEAGKPASPLVSTKLRDRWFDSPAADSPRLDATSQAAVFGDLWEKREWLPTATTRDSEQGAAMTAPLPQERRDWNHEYQSLVDALVVAAPSAAGQSKDNPGPEGSTPTGTAAGDRPQLSVSAPGQTEQVRRQIHQLYTEFADMAQIAIATIVGEMFTPSRERTIPPHSMGVYHHGGACFLLSFDTTGGTLGGDRNAMKVAAQALRAHQHLSSVAPKYLLYVPLTFMMTHLGFRVLVTSVPPVHPTTRLQVDQLQVSTEGPGSMLADCARELGVKPHAVTLSDDSPALLSPLPWDAGVYWGRDGRLYLLNTYRLLPPIAPVATSSPSPEQQHTVSPLVRRLRPEVLAGCGRALSSDAFVPGCSTEDDASEVTQATAWNRDVNIPTVGAVLGMLEPTLAETVEYTCCATGQHVTDQQQLAFVICSNEEECCLIGPQPYVDLSKLAYWEGKMDEAQTKLDGYVKCGHPSRSLVGLVMKPDVTNICHAHGLNLRYLAYAWASIPELSRPCVAHYVEVEMAARAAKDLMWRGLREATDKDERRAVCINLYLALLTPEGETTEQFWSGSLGPAIAENFGVHVPLNRDRLDPYLLHKRVSDMTGVSLTTESLQSFYTDEPFVQLEEVHPAMKTSRLPALVEIAGERSEYAETHRAALRRLDQYWWGQVSSQQQQARWKGLRPVYLNDSEALPWQE